MRRALIGLAFVWVFAGVAQADDIELNCENPTTTMEHDFCADREAGVVDAEMNVAYRALRQTLGESRRALLTDAQRAWIAFRDKQCNAVRVLMDGSGRNVAYLECVMGLTRTRTRDFRELAAPR